MKIIKVVGMNNISVKMFALELAWAISCKNSVCLQMDDYEFYKLFSFKKLNVTSLGNLEFLLNEDSTVDRTVEAEYIVTCLDVDADLSIYVLEQSLESVEYLNDNYDYDNLFHSAFVYLDFIESCYDSEYFKKFKFDKNINTRDMLEFEIPFDEDSKVCQLENQLNGYINLRKYPKRRKQALYNISRAVVEEERGKYREFYRILDNRVPTC